LAGDFLAGDFFGDAALAGDFFAGDFAALFAGDCLAGDFLAGDFLAGDAFGDAFGGGGAWMVAATPCTTRPGSARGGSGKKRETRCWYSAYAAYLRRGVRDASGGWRGKGWAEQMVGGACARGAARTCARRGPR